MNPDIKLLAMDFDGVIADSIMECAVAAYNGYASYSGSDTFLLSPKDIDPYQLSVFIATRPFIRSGEDYIYLFHAINEHVDFENQEDFDSFKSNYIGLKDAFYNEFYSARDRLLNDHYTEWISLNPLFWDMDRFLNHHFEKIHIISTKAKKFIISILAHYGVRINHGNIYSTEGKQSKSEVLNEIMGKIKVKSNIAIFIDDHLDTLLRMNVSNVKYYLASWGYNNKKQSSIKKTDNIESIELEKFYQMFGV